MRPLLPRESDLRRGLLLRVSARLVAGLVITTSALLGGRTLGAALRTHEEPGTGPGQACSASDSTAPGGGEGGAGIPVGSLDTLEHLYLDAQERERAEILACEDWGSFYRAIEMALPHEKEPLLLRRLATRLNLDERGRARLSELLRAEQWAATEEALRRHGLETLYGLLDRPKAERVAFLQRLAVERERVRREFDGAYRELVGASAMALLDEHLRSSFIEIVRNTGDRSVAITGVGALASSGASNGETSTPRRGPTDEAPGDRP